MTAQRADVGVLDATADPLGGDLAWAAVHRARPRTPLTCRECGHGLHAKVSPKGLRFFAHDAAAPNCALAGETIAHRLLKLQLASAIRDAGWFAQLEVSGDGRRADVLATSPDGARRMAWEAQLAQITLDDLRTRTARMEASGLRVCWVTDHDRTWLGEVPSIRIGPSSEEAGPPHVIAGLGQFHRVWCSDRRRCADGDAPNEPCPGHRQWSDPPPLALQTFVSSVLRDVVRAHRTRTWNWMRRRHEPDTFVWTTKAHFQAENEQLAAHDDWRRWCLLQDAHDDRKRHLAAIAAKQARQLALTPAAVERIRREARGYVGVRDPKPEWGMGVPLFVHDMPQGVISPVATRITKEVRERFRGLTLFVASETERRTLQALCEPEQRIELLAVEIPLISAAREGE